MGFAVFADDRFCFSRLGLVSAVVFFFDVNGDGGVFNIRRSTSSSRSQSFCEGIMPPQPLSKVRPKARVIIHQSILTHYPALAQHVLSVIALGSETEAIWATILTDLLQSKAKIGLAMYEALSSQEGRRAAVLGAAKAKLSPRDFQIVEAVLSATKSERKRRNDFAHYLWAGCEEIPNALLLVEPTAQIRGRIELKATVTKIFRDAARGIFNAPGGVLLDPRGAIDKSKVYVYRDRDLKEAVADAQTANATVNDLSIYLWSGSKRVPSRQQLLSWPKVRQALKLPDQKSGRSEKP